jgi:hypothetical protein
MIEECASPIGADESTDASNPDPRIFCFDVPQEERAFERTVVELMGRLVGRWSAIEMCFA